MDKLKLAHEYFMKHVNTDQYRHLDDEDLILWSFDYVDAMQAEADKRECKERPDVLSMANSPQLDWQPDWSQAPAWANWWAMDLDNKQAHWYEVEPIADAIAWRRRTRTCKQAPSFDYQGNWKESLRKRPQ